jgi:PPP family 3-phenylpropionic acid transporter
VIGALWALAVICEILLFTSMDRVVARLGTQSVMVGCLVIAAGRWLLIGSVTGLPWLVLGQTLHAFTYAAFHVAAIRVVYRRFGPQRRARGQAVYSGMTFGLGILLGSLAAGWLVGPLGLSRVFIGSAGVALLAGWLVGPLGLSRVFIGSAGVALLALLVLGRSGREQAGSGS